jgi:uncharacterized protein YecE (DUF72 family)
MRVLVGTSGYSYKEWKGPFYPDRLPAAEMLHFYAGKLGTVEINNTFYRMPSAHLLGEWASQVPEGFVFALKAPQRITHQMRLKDAAETTGVFVRMARTLVTKLGPVVFQLPPFFKKDTPRLADFLATWPADLRVAFEFRHPSWFADDVYETLRSNKAALCAAESDDLASPVVSTTDWGYLRLRRTEYSEADLEAWTSRILSQKWKEAFAYVKHDEGNAPALAARLIERLARAPGP